MGASGVGYERRKASARAFFVARKEATAASVQVRVWDLALPEEMRMEGLHEASTVWEKAVIEIHQSYEPTKLALRLRLWKITNGLNFLR